MTAFLALVRIKTGQGNEELLKELLEQVFEKSSTLADAKVLWVKEALFQDLYKFGIENESNKRRKKSKK